jgi:exodeoxyribonuclease-3
MQVATWNVNSLRVRQDHVLDWLKAHGPDVLCLQEIKMVDEVFPADQYSNIGYHAVVNGQKTYNGVAMLSKQAMIDINLDIPGLEDPQRRFLAGTIDDIRVINVYVPNGQDLASEKFVYKLKWFRSLHNYIKEQLQNYERLVLMGDFNITPTNDDVHDPEEWAGGIHCSDEERAVLQDLLDLGLNDSFRKFSQEPASFSWWDYRAAAFRRNRGLRIDLVLSSDRLNESCTACYIDKEPRKLDRPSDHTPVVAEFELQAETQHDTQ